MDAVNRNNDCLYCGECLSRCIYLKLDPSEAAEEMRALDEGRETPHIDAGCISCYACNAFCPNGADPYGRILERFAAGYRENGLPERARYMMPTSPKSFRSDIVDRLPPDERLIVESWEKAVPEGQVLYPGCNLITTPYLTQSGLFDEITVAGSLELCCGEMYFRMGLADKARSMARGLADYYSGRSIERMIFVCPACYNMFAHEMPRRFGVEFDFPMVFITDYLAERLQKGTLSFPDKLDMSVTIHDSCHARIMEPGFMERQRELLELMGAVVKEADYNRQDGICCGIAAGVPRQSPVDILKTGTWAHREYKRTDAEAVMAYCTGCYLTLAMLRPYAPLGIPVMHLLELVAKAMGKPVRDRIGPRTRSMLAGILRNTAPALLSRRRFRIDSG